jgi:hypothetical protein
VIVAPLSKQKLSSGTVTFNAVPENESVQTTFAGLASAFDKPTTSDAAHEATANRMNRFTLPTSFELDLSALYPVVNAARSSSMTPG